MHTPLGVQRARHRMLAAAACIVLFAATVSTLPAQRPSADASKSMPGQFVILKGTDTVAVETFAVSSTALTGQIVQPNGPRSEYTLLLRPDGLVEHASMARTFKAGGQLAVTLDFTDKRVTGSVTVPAGTESFEMTTTGPSAPFFVLSFALAEQLLRSAALPVGKSAGYLAFRLGAADTATVTVTRFSTDSASLTMADVGIKVALSADGRVTGGTHLAQPWIVRRTR